MQELYCGIDIHKETYAGCIMDKDGEVIREHVFPASKEGFDHFIMGIPSSNIQIAIEACGIWRGAYKIITESGYKVKLGNPVKTNAIACKKKTDKVDAKILADLLRTKYLPEIFIPDEYTLNLRDIVRHKSNLTRFRVKIQNKIKGYLLREGIKYHKRIWNEKSLHELEKLDNLGINDLIQTYRYFKEKEKNALNRIKKISQNTRLARLLMTHPGIGDFGSLMMIAEIGDIKRFDTSKHLISYAGLCPGIHQSANTSYSVTNHAVNKWLKWIITECSGRASMLDTNYMTLYEKFKKKKGFKVARRVIQRKMLNTVYHMLKNNEPYYASYNEEIGQRASSCI